MKHATLVTCLNRRVTKEIKRGTRSMLDIYR